MSISQGNFNRQCLRFASECRGFGEEDWFVSFANMANRSQSIDGATDLSDLDEARLMLEKNTIEFDPLSNEVRTGEYNVVYNEAYEVPVMYFCESRQDGSLLGLDETISKLKVPCNSEELGQVLSQVEHPILFRPFFMIHPCRTRDFMKIHTELDESNYLISWLSTVCALIGLKLDNRLGKLVKN